MNAIALQRLHLLTAPSGKGLSSQERLVLHSELALLGYRISNQEELEHVSSAYFRGAKTKMKTLAKMRGGGISYVPLFLRFPDDCPSDDAYFAKRILGYLGNRLELFAGEPSLDDGTKIPRWLFDLNEFGADPITQMQDLSLLERAKKKLLGRKSDTHVEWIDLEVISEKMLPERLLQWVQTCLYAKSSIKEVLHADLATCLQRFGTAQIDVSKITMKENLALLLRLLWQQEQYDEVIRCAQTPTDILRLFAALTESDISLTQPISFPKCSKKQRRVVLSILEASSDLAADLKRYKGLWKAVGRGLHPGQYKHAFPKTAAAFDQLRNGTIVTFDGQTEALLKGGRLKPLLAHLSKRPGVLARKLHEILRTFEAEQAEAMTVFEAIAATLPVKNLLILKSYFACINDRENRAIVTKKGNFKVVENNAKGALGPEILQRLQTCLESAILDNLATKESWSDKKVWIDPVLSGYTIPFAQRAASEGLLTLARGSRIPVDCEKVLRLFVYWKQSETTTDLDLSAMQLGEDFNYIGHVSYTNLSDQGIAHSGDIQSAPGGAAEFIDVDLSCLGKEVRYLAVEVNRYYGEAFGDMQCHAGWMVRDKVCAKYKSFDIKTVQNKFNLNGRAGICIPLIVDLKNQEIIMTDLYVGSRNHFNAVENSSAMASAMCREIASFTETRPTLLELAQLHLRARKGVPSTKVDAEICFGVKDCTYSAVDIEHLLSELL